MRAIGINAFLEKKFDCYEFEDRWYQSFNCPEKNFKAIVYGASGNGKTEFCIQLAKYLTKFGKVYYNSFEQGISKSLQDALKRTDMKEVSGKIIFGDKETFEEMMERLGKRNSPRFIIIDSRDFINLTITQYKEMVNKYGKRKAIIVVCWESAGKPKGEHAKQIEYITDIKINVRNFKAYPRCRYGGNVPFDIWPDRKKSGQGKLF